MTRPVRIGAALVLLYVVVAAATASWAPGRLRPLFDGFGTHTGPYNWVNPPEEFAAGNRQPADAEIVLELDDSGSEQSFGEPADGQMAVSLQPGSLAGHPPDKEAALTITPVDASTLGPLPAGLRPESNAYRLDLVYEPSGTKVVDLDKPGTLGVIAAAPADTLLYSLDGTSWDTVQGQPLTTGANGITGSLAATGYYLAAAKGALRELSGAPSSGGGATVVLLVAVGVVTMVAAWFLVVRRQPTTPTRGRPASGRPASGQRSGPARGGKSGGRGAAGKGNAGKGNAGKGNAGKGNAGKGPTPRRK